MDMVQSSAFMTWESRVVHCRYCPYTPKLSKLNATSHKQMDTDKRTTAGYCWFHYFSRFRTRPVVGGTHLRSVCPSTLRWSSSNYIIVSASPLKAQLNSLHRRVSKQESPKNKKEASNKNIGTPNEPLQLRPKPALPRTGCVPKSLQTLPLFPGVASRSEAVHMPWHAQSVAPRPRLEDGEMPVRRVIVVLHCYIFFV